jgi:hypothetical protein
MPTPLLERKKAVVVCLETEYGVAPAIETGSLMLATELSITPYQGNTVERTRIRPEFGGYAQINTGPNTQVQITVPWSGSGEAPVIGTSVVAPAWGVLARACQMQEVEDLDAGEVTYTRVSEEGDSVTIYYLHDGQQQCVKGVRGTLTGTANTGALPTLAFTMTGLYERPTTVSPITLTVENQADEIPVNFQNTTEFTLLGHEAIGQNFSFDLANTVTFRDLINYQGVHITDSAPTGQASFQMPRLVDFDIFEKTESHQVVTTGAVAFSHGTVPGNIVGARGPKVQMAGMTTQDSDGITHVQSDLRWLAVDGDDELVLFSA